jgi:hypothetical protein
MTGKLRVRHLGDEFNADGSISPSEGEVALSGGAAP